MAKPLVRHTMRRVIDSYFTCLRRPTTTSASILGNLSSETASGSEQFFYPSVFSHLKEGFELFQNTPASFANSSCNRKFSTKVGENGNKVKTVKKAGKSPQNPESELTDYEKLCTILNGDVTLEDLDDKLEATGIKMPPHLLEPVINASEKAGRKALGFYKWAIEQPGCEANLDSFNALIDLLGKRNDFKAVETLLKENLALGSQGLKVDLKTFEIVVQRLVKAGREKKTVDFFQNMEEYGFKQDEKAQKIVVRELSELGFASHAEKLVKEKADVYYPDEEICNMLVKGWCVAGKLSEARRMVNEMSVGKFAMDATAYNALLDCVCKLCIEKDHFLLLPEAKKILLRMEKAGVPRNEMTFNILITHLCDIRKTSDAVKLFSEMEGYGCSPNLTTYVVMIRSLFLAARVAEGYEMLDKMKENGFEAHERDYFSFIKVLCKIQRVEHAHKVFLIMKDNGCRPAKDTYELLIRKLSRSGHNIQAKKVLNEAIYRKVIRRSESGILEPSRVQTPMKKTKRLTLAMKRKKQNLKLKKLRLSFVKKPKKPAMRFM
uniref:Pentacotripeptide-repeat region of PRORP domain-containing protein n=1 Tax=Araucaria cunninghamii TaxID=56994 RepID=A0A0D6QSP3_ARACU